MKKHSVTSLSAGLAVLVAIVFFTVRQPSSAQEPLPPAVIADSAPLASHPEPSITSLGEEVGREKGWRPQTFGELRAAFSSDCRFVGNAFDSFPLDDAHSLLKLRVIDPESGETITAKSFAHFWVEPLFTIPEDQDSTWPRVLREAATTFGTLGAPLVFYWLIASDLSDDRYDKGTFSNIIRSGESYSFGGTIDGGMDFYSEFTVPRDIGPPQCVTFNIPAGVGIHPSLRPDTRPRLKITIDPKVNPPVNVDKWMAFYYFDRNHYDQSTRNLSPSWTEFRGEDLTADFGKVPESQLGEPLTVTNPDRSITWMYISKVSQYAVVLPRDADFVLENIGDIRSTEVKIPARLSGDGREARHLELGIMHEDAFIPLTRTGITEEFLPKDAIAYEHRLLDTAKVSWLPGTYDVTIKGSPFVGISLEQIEGLPFEQRIKTFSLPKNTYTLATGTVTIPASPIDDQPIEIENLELVDLNMYRKYLNQNSE